MKKIFALILCVFILTLALASCDKIKDVIPGGDGTNEQGEAYSEGLRYRSNGDGTCTLVNSGIFEGSELIIPETSPEGDRVVAIAYSAFSGERDIVRLVIPDSVTYIGEGMHPLA